MARYITIAVLAGLFIVAGCSKDEEPSQKTFEANTSFSFTQTNVWPQRYKIVVGAFGADTLVPLVYSEVTKPIGLVSVTAKLNNVPETALYIKLYIANPSGRLIYTLYSYPVSNPSGLVEIPEIPIKLLSFNRVQVQVLNSCTACHGGSSGLPAAGLNLMSGVSYDNLVNHVATNSTKYRVLPGNSENSFIIDVLRKKQSVFTHSASNTIAEEDIELIESWIENGASN